MPVLITTMKVTWALSICSMRPAAEMKRTFGQTVSSDIPEQSLGLHLL